MEMPEPTLGVKAVEPKNIFLKPLRFEFGGLLKALAKGAGHYTTGKWAELGSDAAEAATAIGIVTGPEELAFVLITRSAIRAMFELVGDSASLLPNVLKTAPDAFSAELRAQFQTVEFEIDRRFLDRPAELPLIKSVQNHLRLWLIDNGVNPASAATIAARLPTYFVFALNDEWVRDPKRYQPLTEALNSPFANATERERAWTRYGALLQRRIEESVFDEPFSLAQIFVPLNAYYIEERGKGVADRGESKKRNVVSVDAELDKWAYDCDQRDALKVVTGGPGSGKSSLARMFAARLAARKKRVLFIPLHQIDPTKGLAEEIGRYVSDQGILPSNPLGPASAEPDLTIILDGLDELSSQGKAAVETARSFVREVEKALERRNAESTRLRVLLSGREIVVQENESEFRRPRQILYLLPYLVDNSEGVYVDAGRLLEGDLRGRWWRTYGRLTGKVYDGLPAAIKRDDLDEITAQPLLNFLLALSFSRGKVDFGDAVNLNVIYADLVEAVYERGYERTGTHASIRSMAGADFVRVLEEVGLAAWHGDGRTTTVAQIEEHCRTSGVDRLLEDFKEGAKAGVTRLLAAFFFRQYGTLPTGDPTFEFTHKSFGEYLAAKRLVRGVEKLVRELDRRAKSPDDGLDDRDALVHWAQLCGPTEVSPYIQRLFVNEIRLREEPVIAEWQKALTRLFNYVLRHGMPMERFRKNTFQQSMYQSRNAEEALLMALNGCARRTNLLSVVEGPTPESFGAWLKRVQGQRTGHENRLVMDCLSYLQLRRVYLYIADLDRANLFGANLGGAILGGADLSGADLSGADLSGADLSGANLTGANLRGADLRGANLIGADVSGADLDGARGAPRRFKRTKLAKP